MTAPELKLYYADKSDIWEDNDVGEYVRFADVEAYTQAAIAAAMGLAADAAYEADSLELHSIGATKIVERILSTTPTDATAALDTMLAEAKKRGRDRGLEEAAAKITKLYDCGTGEKWTAAIRALKGKE